MTKQKPACVPTARKAWATPKLIRIGAGKAENNLNPIRSDGVISMGS